MFAALFAALLVPQFTYPQTPEAAIPLPDERPVSAAEAVSPGTAVPETGASEANAAASGISGRPDESGYILADAPETAAGASFPVILRMVLVLALVAGIIYLVVFFLRKVSRPQAAGNPHLKILASTHLGNGRFVHVVSLGTQAWLIGAGEGGISRIADINDKEALDAMLLEASEKAAEEIHPISGFRALLKRFSASGESEENRLENIKKRRERFKRF
jgi:flagellar protein FliO/FliZ